MHKHCKERKTCMSTKKHPIKEIKVSNAGQEMLFLGGGLQGLIPHKGGRTCLLFMGTPQAHFQLSPLSSYICIGLRPKPLTKLQTIRTCLQWGGLVFPAYEAVHHELRRVVCVHCVYPWVCIQLRTSKQLWNHQLPSSTLLALPYTSRVSSIAEL